jgi:hypothetical protein
VEQPRRLVGDFYVGRPMTQAVAPAENVRRLVYRGASQLDIGEAPLSTLGGEPAPGLEVYEGKGEDGVGLIKITEPVELLYGDVDPDFAQQAVAQLGLQAFAAVTQPLTEAAWRHHPSTYIICEANSALPSFVQEMMAKRAERVRRIQSSYSPFPSQPAELAALIREELVL